MTQEPLSIRRASESAPGAQAATMGTELSGRRFTRENVANLLVSRTALTQLDKASAARIVARMVPQTFHAKEILFREGSDESKHLMLIIEGEAIVETGNANPNDSLVYGAAGPGHIVGEMSMIDGEPRSATVTAMTDLTVATLTSTAMSDLIAQDPTTGCVLLAALLRRTAERLRVANKKLKANTAINRALDKELDAAHSVLDREINKKRAMFKSVARPAGQVVIGNYDKP